MLEILSIVVLTLIIGYFALSGVVAVWVFFTHRKIMNESRKKLKKPFDEVTEDE